MNDGGDLETKSAPASSAEQKTAPGSTLRTFILWLFAGLLLGGIAALFIIRWKYGDALPEVTPADYFAAKDKWQENAPADYDIEVAVTGTRPSTYRVQVRGGEAVAASIVDQQGQETPQTQQRTFGTWSVPGMFGTMSKDVEVLDKHAKGKADKFTPRLTLRAEFDPNYGYPAAYRRIQWGSAVEVKWKVTKFEVIRQR
jgi:hypothetical protein